MKLFLLTMTLGGILAAVMFGVLTGWDGAAMSMHGCIYPDQPIAADDSLAGGAGLMALVSYSARKGYEARIEIDRPDQQD